MSTGGHSRGLLKQSGLTAPLKGSLTVDFQGENSNMLPAGVGIQNLWLSDKWIKRIHHMFPYKHNLKEAGDKNKHVNASSTRLMLRIPVITECLHACIIQGSSSYPGDHHPDQICVYV